MRRATDLEAKLVERNNGVIYYSESHHSNLVLVFRGEFKTLRKLSSVKLTASIECRSLGFRKPSSWGLFKKASLEWQDWDTESIAEATRLFPQVDEPDYFETAIMPFDEQNVPEVLTAVLAKLTIRDEQGVLVGKYLPKN
ncbi:MAG: hypothetical protein K2X38_19840 [Gemmataceae bacterium]|nr:hypothetical protein [Gemmataceae bacterium]